MSLGPLLLDTSVSLCLYFLSYYYCLVSIMEFPLTATGYFRLTGTSARTGNKYEFFKLSALQPVRVADRVTAGAGYVAVQFSLDAAAAASLAGVKSWPVKLVMSGEYQQDGAVLLTGVVSGV